MLGTPAYFIAQTKTNSLYTVFHEVQDTLIIRHTIILCINIEKMSKKYAIDY